MPDTKAKDSTLFLFNLRITLWVGAIIIPILQKEFVAKRGKELIQEAKPGFEPKELVSRVVIIGKGSKKVQK